MERNVWILIHAVSPKDIAVGIATKLERSAIPSSVPSAFEFDAAYDWPADDPRLDAVAERAARWVANSMAGRRATSRPQIPPSSAWLRDAGSSPALERLNELAKANLTDD